MDASNVPGEYALTILSECAAFPRRLVFFLKGSLTVRKSPKTPPALLLASRPTYVHSALLHACVSSMPYCFSPTPVHNALCMHSPP